MRERSYDSAFISYVNGPTDQKLVYGDSVLFSYGHDKEPAVKEVPKVLDQQVSAEQKLRDQSYDTALISSGHNLPFEFEDQNKDAVSYDTALISSGNTEPFVYIKPSAKEMAKVFDQRVSAEQKIRDQSYDSLFISSGHNPVEAYAPCPYSMRKVLTDWETENRKNLSILRSMINNEDENTHSSDLFAALKEQNPDLVPAEDNLNTKRVMLRLLNLHENRVTKYFERLKETLEKADWYDSSIFNEFRTKNPELVPSDLRSFKEAQEASYNEKLSLLKKNKE
jgi:hypothetical protein